MPATAKPFGFKPVRKRDGAWQGQLTPYTVKSGYNTSMFRYDAVTLATDGYLNICAAGTELAGIFMGCQYYDTTQNKMIFSNSWVASSPSSGDFTAFVMDDPDVELLCQANATIAQANIGAQYNLVAGSGSGGFSTQALDISSLLTTILQFRLIRVDVDVSNAIGDAYPNLIVQPVNHQFRVTTGV